MSVKYYAARGTKYVEPMLIGVADNGECAVLATFHYTGDLMKIVQTLNKSEGHDIAAWMDGDKADELIDLVLKIGKAPKNEPLSWPVRRTEDIEKDTRIRSNIEWNTPDCTWVNSDSYVKIEMREHRWYVLLYKIIEDERYDGSRGYSMQSLRSFRTEQEAVVYRDKYVADLKASPGALSPKEWQDHMHKQSGIEPVATEDIGRMNPYRISVERWFFRWRVIAHVDRGTEFAKIQFEPGCSPGQFARIVVATCKTRAEATTFAERYVAEVERQREEARRPLPTGSSAESCVHWPERTS